MSPALDRLAARLPYFPALMLDAFRGMHGDDRVLAALAFERDERALRRALFREWVSAGMTRAAIARAVDCSATTVGEVVRDLLNAGTGSRIAHALAETKARVRAMRGAA